MLPIFKYSLQIKEPIILYINDFKYFSNDS